MRNILLIIFIVGIYGCKKCADCTRTYTFNTKQHDNNGVLIQEYGSYDPDNAVDEQEVCGSDEIRDFEQPTYEYQYDTLPDFTVITTKIGTCTCITK